MIDGHKLIMSLNDWWYSSFGYEETEESKAIKKVIDEVEKYVEHTADRKTEPQRECDADCNEDCAECAKETELWKAEQTEPQTERSE